MIAPFNIDLDTGDVEEGRRIHQQRVTFDSSVVPKTWCGMSFIKMALGGEIVATDGKPNCERCREALDFHIKKATEYAA